MFSLKKLGGQLIKKIHEANSRVYFFFIFLELNTKHLQINETKTNLWVVVLYI